MIALILVWIVSCILSQANGLTPKPYISANPNTENAPLPNPVLPRWDTKHEWRERLGLPPTTHDEAGKLANGEFVAERYFLCRFIDNHRVTPIVIRGELETNKPLKLVFDPPFHEQLDEIFQYDKTWPFLAPVFRRFYKLALLDQLQELSKEVEWLYENVDEYLASNQEVTALLGGGPGFAVEQTEIHFLPKNGNSLTEIHFLPKNELYCATVVIEGKGSSDDKATIGSIYVYWCREKGIDFMDIRLKDELYELQPTQGLGVQRPSGQVIID